MTGDVPNIDIRPDHWRIVRDILARHVPDREVWAFGSRATWTAKEYSDLDLAILGEQPLPSGVRAAVEEDFSESDLPYKVDLVEWAGLGEGFRAIVKRDRVVVKAGFDAVEAAAEASTMPVVEKQAWQTLPLSELVLPERGITYGIVQPGKPVADGVPIIRVANVRGGRIDVSDPLRVAPEIESAYTRTRLRGGELVITIVGTVGETAIVPENLAGWNVARAIAVLPVKPDIGAYWVQIALRAPAAVEMLQSLLNTTVQHTLNLSDLARLPISLPPPEARKAITKVLGALDAKIELNRQMNETLEAMARQLFRDWFVDFGPTRAKMEGRPPYLAPDIWYLFPDRLDDEGKPEGWSIEAVHDQATWVNGAAYKDMHFSSEPDALPVVKIAELKNGITKTTRFTNTDLGKRYKIDDGELLFSWSGNPDTSIDTFVWTSGTAWLNQHIFAVRSNGKRSQTFLYTMLKFLRPDFAEIARNKQTTGLGHVTQQDLIRLKITAPSRDVEAVFDDIAGPLHARFTSNLFKNQSLATLRDTLLPKLMSGEVRIKDAEKLVEEVV
jgi:type I restriction enzyme S subunit